MNGSPSQHIRALYDLAVFAPNADPDSIADTKARADLWIDKKTGVLQKLVIRTQPPKAGTERINMTIIVSLARFNKVQKIDAPLTEAP